MEIWTTRADVVQSYGQSFDELVDLVANAMAATGYHSNTLPRGKVIGLRQPVWRTRLSVWGFSVPKLKKLCRGRCGQAAVNFW